MRNLILSLSVALLPALTYAQGSVECTDPDTESKIQVRVSTIRQQLRTLPRQLERMKVHVLDLPEDAQEHRRRLSQAVTDEAWCRVNAHLRTLEDAVMITRVEEAFVSDKFGRVERWLRSGTFSPTALTASERNVANAAASISSGDHTRANQHLNAAIAAMFGTRGMWDIPAELPEVVSSDGDSGSRAEILQGDVLGGCPALGKRGRGNQDDLDNVMRKLRRTLNTKKIRPTDLPGGVDVVADLKAYRRLKAWWPAIRAACAMTHKAQTAVIDLGFVMGRFHRVGKRRSSVAEASLQKFRESVRGASDAIAERNFRVAHGYLEELSILTGSPSKPAGELE